MHITTLFENSPGPQGLVSGHGLSLAISTSEMEILFDFGPSGALVENAGALDYDLGKVDLAVLSHGHYDHGGGLEAFFAANAEAPLYLGEGAGQDINAQTQQGSHYIGLDRELLRRNSGRLRWISDAMSITPNVHLIRGFPKTFRRPSGNATLKIRQGDDFVDDAFDHEIALVVSEPDGIVIFTGCGHSGVLNIVSAAKARFPNERIKAVVGGFHNMSKLERDGPDAFGDVREIAQVLVKMGCGLVYSGHCTGPDASRILGEEMGETYRALHCGMEFDV